MRAVLFQVCICLLACMGRAEAAPVMPNPALAAQELGVNDEAHRRFLPITELKMDVRLVGAIARTTVQIHFANPTQGVLEGRLSLGLPDSTVVTGYGLDVDEHFIDGVLAEPSRARAAYERRMRRRVDPGLAEVSTSNVFSTRVFPITSQGRTLRVTFVAPVHSLNGWSMPLVTERAVGRVSLSIQAEGVTAAPNITLPQQLSGQWQQQSDAFVLHASAKNARLSGELRLQAPLLAHNMIITTHPNGRRFFQLQDRIAVDASTREAPARVRVYWDRSRSRRDDALAAEIKLLTRYLEATRPGAIDLVLFNSSATTVETFATAAEVGSRLQRVVYRGATSFATLQAAKLANADTCLLFSDGIGTIDNRQTFKPSCDVFALTSARDADIGYLARVMGRSTADVMRLPRDGADDVLARLLHPTPAIVEVRDASGVALKFAALPSARGDVALIGEAPRAGDIVVRIGGSGAQVIERRYQVPPAGDVRSRFDGVGALWAADQIVQLAASERSKELVSVSRSFGVASPHLSFVVLEGPNDYVQARISPPANYPKALREEYQLLKADNDEERRTERDEYLARVITRWEEQKRWWQHEYDPTSAAAPVRESVPAAAPEFDQDITVSGARVARPADASIELPPWSVARPYLKALNAAKKSQLDQVLDSQEQLHGELPAFYLDVAEWFQRRGDSAHATEMLLSALELPATNDETLSIVADRLVRYGQLDRAIWLYQRLIKLAPDRPQPLRSLALALAERAKGASTRAAARDLTRAVTLLNQVITTPWDDAYAGIELVSLMDANALVPKLTALGVSQTILDDRLVAPLDVDLRVTIEWNTPATDVDLWVTEPNGERSMYHNPLTAIGGHLSNDMTEGFGPEEYLLRRAPDGRFALEADVYAADMLNPNGATLLTARLTHNFGRPNERTEIVDFELPPESAGAMPIGAFVLKNQGAGFDAKAAPLAEAAEN